MGMMALSEERLAEIRERWTGLNAQPHSSLLMLPSTQIRRDVAMLLEGLEWLQTENEDLRKTGREQGDRIAQFAGSRIERLEARNAAYREIVQAVARNRVMFGLVPALYCCNWCEVYVGGIFGRTDHRADCPVTKARALLADDSACDNE